jgi:hypothetical protein
MSMPRGGGDAERAAIGDDVAAVGGAGGAGGVLVT